MTRHADWYFDFISPFAYLQFADVIAAGRLPADVTVTLKPVLFAGLLGHWGNLGPAEIPAKRRQTYRFCNWLAAKRGIPFKTPPRHPFNPLGVLRLAVSLDGDQEAVGKIFHHVWSSGQDAQDPAALEALATSIGITDFQNRVNDPTVKDQLRTNTEEATSRGVFGVPTFAVDEELFWGDDMTDMLFDYLADPDGFTGGEWSRLGDLPEAARRKESRL